MKDLSEKEFFFGYLAKYLDGNLTGSQGTRFEEIMKREEYSKLALAFQVSRGKFQNFFSKIHIPDATYKNIRDLLEGQEERFKTEMTKIEAIERSEFAYDLLRRITLTLIVIGLVAAGIYFFKPKSAASFPTLEYVGYESLALAEDPGRLDLPSSEPKDIAQFVKAAPGLDFTPFLLNAFGEGWELQGVSLIDYELKKVIVIKYKNTHTQESLFHFMFGGRFSDLPKAERAQIRGLDYEIFANDRLNFLAWESPGNTLSLLVGRRSAVELAQFARAGTQ